MLITEGKIRLLLQKGGKEGHPLKYKGFLVFL